MQATCRWCEKIEEIPITNEQFNNWKEGELIQNAAPNLTPSQREILISGTCDACWKKMFGE